VRNIQNEFLASAIKYPAETLPTFTLPYHGLSKLRCPFHDRTITVTQCTCMNEGSSSLAETLIRN
jgi:hypothetical protein